MVCVFLNSELMKCVNHVYIYCNIINGLTTTSVFHKGERLPRCPVK